MITLGSDGEMLIKSFETLALTAYQDPGGVWTIGWGHTPADEGWQCTDAQAEDWFQSDVQRTIAGIEATLTTGLAQYQADALISFTYNVGVGNEQHSTMLKLINQRRFLEASCEFTKWDLVAGVPSKGLMRRRMAEQALFTNQPWQQFLS